MTTGAVIFFRGRTWRGGRRGVAAEETAGDARDISNFLITPRGANDLPLSLTLPSLSHSPLISPAFSPFLHFVPLRPSPSILLLRPYPAQVLRTADTTWRHSTPNHLPTVPLFNLTPTSHQSEPLLYLLLRYRSALSPGT